MIHKSGSFAVGTAGYAPPKTALSSFQELKHSEPVEESHSRWRFVHLLELHMLSRSAPSLEKLPAVGRDPGRDGENERP